MYYVLMNRHSCYPFYEKAYMIRMISEKLADRKIADIFAIVAVYIGKYTSGKLFFGIGVADFGKP